MAASINNSTTTKESKSPRRRLCNDSGSVSSPANLISGNMTESIALSSFSNLAISSLAVEDMSVWNKFDSEASSEYALVLGGGSWSTGFAFSEGASSGVSSPNNNQNPNLNFHPPLYEGPNGGFARPHNYSIASSNATQSNNLWPQYTFFPVNTSHTRGIVPPQCHYYDNPLPQYHTYGCQDSNYDNPRPQYHTYGCQDSNVPQYFNSRYGQPQPRVTYKVHVRPMRPFEGPVDFNQQYTQPSDASQRATHPAIILILQKIESLRSNIIKQIEYYFSDENLANDFYLKKIMDEEGWVPVEIIAGFNRMKKLTSNIQIILHAMSTSSSRVEVKEGKMRVRGNWKRWIKDNQL